MPLYDIVILGAGPAGTAAAVTARRAGLSVALIDKARFPRSKLCGGLVTGRCATHLERVFGLGIEPELFDTCRDFEFFLHGRCLASLGDVPPAHLTMRRDLDARLFGLALASGAADYSGQRIGEIDLPGNRLRLQSGETLDYRCLIGADGAQSIVAKKIFGASFNRERIGFALEIEAPAPSPAPGCGPTARQQTHPIRIDFAAADWGYGWAFPKRGSTTIGICGLHARNPDMKARLAAYLQRLGTGQEAAVKGHFLPFGGYRSRPGRGNALLAGDAAGFVDPITGEGIGHAIHSGELAACAAAAAIGLDRPDEALRLYLPLTHPIRTGLRVACLLRPVIFARALQPFFASTFRASQHLKRDYMHLLAGETEYPAILRRTLARLPRAGLHWALRRLLDRPPVSGP